MEQRFDPYMQSFLPLLHPALKAHEDSQLCTVAVGVLGDLSRALGDKTEQYASAFMSVLLENLQSDVLNRNVKVPILSCFADIAMAIGTGFEPYLDTAITVLRQAGAIMPNPVCPFITLHYVLAKPFLSLTSSLSNTCNHCAKVS